MDTADMQRAVASVVATVRSFDDLTEEQKDQAVPVMTGDAVAVVGEALVAFVEMSRAVVKAIEAAEDRVSIDG